ncbi:C-type lectin domain family 4 member A [Sarotherodon galilaeus]
MSTEIQSVEDFRVKYSRGSQEDGRVREQSEVEVLDDGEQHPDVGLQEADEHTEKKLPAVRRSWFRAFEVNLGVLYLLIVLGIMTRCTKTSLTQLQSSYDKLSKNHSQLQEEKTSVLHKKCPDQWTRFGCSCYFKSTESKTWSESRRECWYKGADLVMINSKEEQKFVNKMRGESWIGLRANNTSGRSKWEWVDGSALTQTFWAEGYGNPSYGYYGVCCDSDGKWTQSPGYNFGNHVSKTFICEK